MAVGDQGGNDEMKTAVVGDDTRPFLKWAGGKRQLLPRLLELAPRTFGHYFEPFLGGGALFFALRPARATLSDLNVRLIRTYKGVRDNVDAVIRLLSSYPPHLTRFYYSMRRVDIDVRGDTEVAAWFIYMNKTAYNGLYRVNRRNQFNVPFGRYKNPTICDEPTLRACSSALAGTELRAEDFEVAVARAKRGDFVYFDPPYVPLSATSSFTSYTWQGFSARQHRRLRDVALRLKRRGVSVLLSNSSTPLVRDLYSDGFELIEVSATRMINSKATERGAVTELIIR
jgi:DNA adenine methylase